jgi:hypothetical protein
MNEIHFRGPTGQPFSNVCGGPLGFHDSWTNMLEHVTCKGCLQAGEWQKRVTVRLRVSGWGTRSRAEVSVLAEDECQAHMYAEWIAEAETARLGEHNSWVKAVKAYRARYGVTLAQSRDAVLLAAHEAAIREDDEHMLRMAQHASDAKALLANFTPLPASTADVEDLRMRVAALEAAVQRLSDERFARLRGAPVNAAMDVSAGRTYSGNGRGVHDFRSSIGSDGLCSVIVNQPSGAVWQCGEPVKSAIHDPQGYAAYVAKLKSALGVWQDKTFLF